MMNESDVYQQRQRNTSVSHRGLPHVVSFGAALSLYSSLTYLYSSGACSALFLQKIALEAKESSDGSVVTLENVRQASTKHDFLEGVVLDGVREQSAPKRPRKKKPRLDSDVKDTAVQQAMVASAATAAASFQTEIKVDEEEYD